MKIDDTVRVTFHNKRYICLVKQIRSDGFGGVDCDKPIEGFDLFFLWGGVQKVAVLT